MRAESETARTIQTNENLLLRKPEHVSQHCLPRGKGYKIATLPVAYFFLDGVEAQRGQQGGRLPSHENLCNFSNCLVILQVCLASGS